MFGSLSSVSVALCRRVFENNEQKSIYGFFHGRFSKDGGEKSAPQNTRNRFFVPKQIYL